MSRNIIFTKIFVICMVVLILIMTAQNMVFAVEDSSDESSETPNKMIYVSIYDEIENQYLLGNTKLYITEDFKVVDTLKKLKESELIKDYANFSNGAIASIIFNDNTFKTVDNGAKQLVGFYFKLNGAKVSYETAARLAKNGDIVEIFYTVEQVWVEAQTSSNNSSSEPLLEISGQEQKPVTSYWNTDFVKKLNESTEWLNLYGDESVAYVTAMGVAGKSADIKAINGLVTDIQKTTEYEDPTEISKRIVAATFCGFDASSSAYGQLLRQLYTYKDIMKDGIFGAIDTLRAYDSNSYELESTALNSREKMVDALLTYQHDNGGFKLTKIGSTDIKVTAQAMMVLSNYKGRSDVMVALNEAVEYLAKLQLDTAGFEYQGKESGEVVALVIAALSAIGVDLEDKRFVKGGDTLIENFIDYNNADGGFTNILGGKSTISSTQTAVIALTSIKKSANPYKVVTKVAQKEIVTSQPTIEEATKMESTIVIAATLAILLSLGVIIIARRITLKRKNYRRN